MEYRTNKLGQMEYIPISQNIYIFLTEMIEISQNIEGLKEK